MNPTSDRREIIAKVDALPKGSTILFKYRQAGGRVSKETFLEMLERCDQRFLDRAKIVFEAPRFDPAGRYLGKDNEV